jgi:hypothetical protein
MKRIRRVSRIPFDAFHRPAPAFWEGNALTRFQACQSNQTTKSGKRECYETFQSEKAVEKQ